MKVVSLGRAARSKAGIKVRQPLASATAFVASDYYADGLRRLADQVIDELNVREVKVLVLSELFSEPYTVPDDLLKHLPDGAALAEDSGYAVGLDTRLTPELESEGLARELVHRIQNMRKAAGFEISDRITVSWQGPERLREVFAAHGGYIREETLADAVTEGPPPAEAHVEEQKLEGQPLTLAVQRA
jgi:isoleucyl-tRNA synthetase